MLPFRVIMTATAGGIGWGIGGMGGWGSQHKKPQHTHEQQNNNHQKEAKEPHDTYPDLKIVSCELRIASKNRHPPPATFISYSRFHFLPCRGRGNQWQLR